MIKKWIESWQSFPPLHKRRFYQGLGLYVLLVAGAGAWVFSQADEAVKDWQERIPTAETPIRAVYETPQITDADGAGAFQNTDALPQGAGYISLIMSDIGLADLDTSRAMNDLPAEIAIAISPYSEMTSDIFDRAKERGREAILLLPMEPDTYPLDDPGPDALLMRRGDAENLKYLTRMLSNAPGAVAAMNFMGSRFLSDEKKLYPVMNALHEKGLFFIETPGTGQSVAAASALASTTPHLNIDVRIDDKAQESAIRQSLLDLEKVARMKGYAVGVAHPYPLSFNLIKAWADTLEKRGIRLMPISTMPKIKVQADTRRAITAPDETPEPASVEDAAAVEDE